MIRPLPCLSALTALLVTSALGCASSRSQAAGSPPPADRASSPTLLASEAQLAAVLADTANEAGRVYRPSEVARRAAALGGQPIPPWPVDAEGCAELRYVVSAAGRVEPGTVVVANGSTAALAAAMLRALATERFQPAERPRGIRVRQVVELIVLKRGRASTISRDGDLLEGHCPRPEL